MTRIKIIDIPELQRAAAIVARLQETLLRLRKRKMARDLIGNDERSAEFGVEDFEGFAYFTCPALGTGG